MTSLRKNLKGAEEQKELIQMIVIIVSDILNAIRTRY